MTSNIRPLYRTRLIPSVVSLALSVVLTQTTSPTEAQARDARNAHGAAHSNAAAHRAHGKFRHSPQHHTSRHHKCDEHKARKQFVKRAGTGLKLGGEEFRFVGTNNYYLPYKSQHMVDSVLETAASQGFTVMRTWGGFDIGNLDGSASIAGKAEGVYFQHWDGDKPVVNAGADGLQHLDYVIAKAGEVGLKLVIPFVNNWRDFGGMDQYVMWAGGQYHDDFYTNPQIRTWYKKWIYQLLNHKNSITGVRYKDDPTIMGWELANEPRCGGSGDFPRSDTCDADVILQWADDVSRFVKHVDNKHLLSAGDEGFYCEPGAADWIDSCNEGVDTIGLASLPHMDMMSFHLYPESWGKTTAWGTEWIERHLADALAIGKPAMLGEFGYTDQSQRNPVYKEWLDTVDALDGAGALFWMLAAEQDDGTLYPDYDGHTIYCPGAVCTTLSNYAALAAGADISGMPPVADNDVAETESGQLSVVAVLANDIGFAAALATSSIDLDPSTAVQDTSYMTAGGVFTAAPDGTVTFAADSNFQGLASAEYVVRDALGNVSNVASIDVTVTPPADQARLLHSFEADVEGWSGGAGTTSISGDFATLGSSSLRIDATGGDWFGTVYGTPLDLSGSTTLSWDIKTTDAGTSQNSALQLGDAWSWCQGTTWGWVNGDTSTTYSVDLTTLDCGGGVLDLGNVKSLRIFLGNGGGTGPIYLDNVRVE